MAQIGGATAEPFTNDIGGLLPIALRMDEYLHHLVFQAASKINRFRFNRLPLRYVRKIAH